MVKKPLLRLNQLLERFLRSVAEGFDECIEGAWAVDAVVDMILGAAAVVRGVESVL